MLKSFISWFASPIALTGAGVFFGPLGSLVGFVIGLLADHFIKAIYPKRKMTIWLEKTGYYNRYWEAYADFLWYKNIKIINWTHNSSKTYGEAPLKEYILELISKETSAAENRQKEFIYSPPKPSKPSETTIIQDIEHIKQVAAQNGVKLPDALEKIEEIRRKTYQDEPPAKPMVDPPVVTKVEGHCVTYKKGGKTMTRSRQGFTKQYGEPVLSKVAPEPPKKVTKKAKARAKV